MKLKKIPTIIALIILALGAAAGVFSISSKKIFKLGASPDTTPKNVRVTNITDSSFTVSWTTAKETASFLKWGTSQSVQDTIATDEIAKQGFLHSTNVSGLTASEIYYFTIFSGENEYDNNGNPWQANTGPQISGTSSELTISGSLLKATGSPAGGAIIYFSIPGGSPLSTITSPNGSYIYSLQSARNNDLSSFYQAKDDDLIEITAQAGPSGTATAQIYLKSAKSVPPIILGQVHDFTNLPDDTSLTTDNPTANLKLPEEKTQEEVSGFAMEEEITTSSTNITVESVDNGEIITSEKPEFFGAGPAGTKITIKIESEQVITDEITVGTNGKWNWSPPENLAEGSHSMVLSWTDINGIMHTISKTFVVQAAEKPAFVASGSATPIATATPTVTLPPEPVSGVGSTTVILTLMAIGFIALGGTTLFLTGKEKYF